MAVNLKLGVDYSSFKQGLEQAKASVNLFEAALEKNEAQLKKTGDAEEYMRQKSAILQQQIEAQQKVVDQYRDALQKMQDSGNAGSKAFETMTTNLLKAETKLTKMETDLQNVGKESETADEKLKSIGEGVSWENVTNGLKTITDQLERGARAAINFGKRVARSAMDSTAWADDVLTRATQYGIDAETLQKMENVADYIDTDVDTIISARDRLAKNRESLPELLGISTDGKSADDLFWEAGEAIMNLGEAFDKSEIAQKVFGRGWRELLPLFTAGREAYEGMMDQQNVLTNEQVENLGKADDAIKSFQQQIELMKNQFWAENSDKIMELLQWLIDNEDGVVTALTAIGGAFTAIKIGEFALNLKKVTDGLGSLFGKGGTPTTTGTGTNGGGGGGSGWLQGAWTGVKNVAADLLPALANDAAVIGAAILPALIANSADYARSEQTRQARINAVTGRSDMNADFVRAASEALVLRAGENPQYQAIEALLMGLQDRKNQQQAELVNTLGPELWGRLTSYWSNGDNMADFEVNQLLQDITDAFAASDAKAKIPIEPEVPDDTASVISDQIGTVPVKISVSGLLTDFLGMGVGHANGLSFVPNTGLYLLHRGEQVVPAREVAHRNYSSNLYVESMYMNNGTDAEGLASAMAAAQRRTMSGFGS